jgi:hypothetical protein
MKMLYRSLSLVVSVLGGILAGAVFKKVWAVVSGEEEAPEATSPDYSTKEVLIAAAVQGAIFAVVKAAVDRAGAKGIKKITGTDPGRQITVACRLPTGDVRSLAALDALPGVRSPADPARRWAGS